MDEYEVLDEVFIADWYLDSIHLNTDIEQLFRHFGLLSENDKYHCGQAYPCIEEGQMGYMVKAFVTAG